MSWKAEVGYHYDVPQLATAWGVSRDFVYDLIDDLAPYREDFPINRWSRPQRPGKRPYTMIKIPWTTAQKMYDQSFTTQPFPRPALGEMRATGLRDLPIGAKQQYQRIAAAGTIVKRA